MLNIPLVFGKRNFDQKRGYAVHYCGICHKPRVFQIREQFSGQHFYFLPFGKRTPISWVSPCTSCGYRFDFNPDEFSSFARNKGPVHELIPATHPEFEQRYQNRLTQSQMVHQDPYSLDTSERRSIIQEVFESCDFIAEDIETRGEADRLTALGCSTWFIIAAAAGIFFIHSAGEETRVGLSLILLGASIILGAACSYWLQRTAYRRIVPRKVLPWLARGLSPLRITYDEIQDFLDPTYTLSRTLTSDQILQAAQSFRDPDTLPGRDR